MVNGLILNGRSFFILFLFLSSKKMKKFYIFQYFLTNYVVHLEMVLTISRCTIQLVETKRIYQRFIQDYLEECNYSLYGLR